MRRIELTEDPNGYDTMGEEAGLIHYDGCPTIGSHTLCGHTDWIGTMWEETKRRVNCKSCIAIRNHVLGRSR